jgi:hypothetical protein
MRKRNSGTEHSCMCQAGKPARFEQVVVAKQGMRPPLRRCGLPSREEKATVLKCLSAFKTSSMRNGDV